MAEDLAKGLALTPDELKSPAWVSIRAKLERMLVRRREQNDKDLNVEQTYTLRSEIRVIKNLLTLGKPAPAVEKADDIPD